MLFISALIIFILIIVASAVKIAREYERGVIFRLGRLILPPKGPGIFLIIPIVDRMIKISLRTVVMDVPPQDVITRDNVSIRVNAVVYFRVMQADTNPLWKWKITCTPPLSRPSWTSCSPPGKR
jgi:regulator of protease activity HflC (stomatin/prohibitin superfamily)